MYWIESLNIFKKWISWFSDTSNAFVTCWFLRLPLLHVAFVPIFSYMECWISQRNINYRVEISIAEYRRADLVIDFAFRPPRRYISVVFSWNVKRINHVEISKMDLVIDFAFRQRRRYISIVFSWMLKKKNRVEISKIVSKYRMPNIAAAVR